MLIADFGIDKIKVQPSGTHASDGGTICEVLGSLYLCDGADYHVQLQKYSALIRGSSSCFAAKKLQDGHQCN
jgi:hypothetical protein